VAQGFAKKKVRKGSVEDVRFHTNMMAASPSIGVQVSAATVEKLTPRARQCLPAA
jgi:hypothetical protein